MNQNERYYRSVTGAVGTGMLVFLLLLNVVGIGLSFLDVLFRSLLADPLYDVAYQTVYAAGYLLSFMLPVLVIKRAITKRGYAYQPMKTSLRLSPWIFLIIPAGIAVVFSASYFNASMVSIFHYSEISSEILWGEGGEAPAVYKIILDFIVICVVPGFCEEFLFRGAILSNCRPFGRANAILISSFLFAMMHQNAEQIFYAFVAGIFFGLVYEKTGSIWSCTVLHILNNFLSVGFSLIFYKYGEAFESQLYTTALEVVIFLVGVIALMSLVFFFSRKEDIRGGFFGKKLPVSDGYAACPIEPKRAVRLFLTPTMVIFLCLCVVQLLFLLILFTWMAVFGFALA